ncbi:MAG: cobalamin biosynthesis protein [Natronomonas sp.]
MSVETGSPRDLLSAHPETAYFWGRVIGDGTVSADSVTVRTNDETAARRLASIAGADSVDHRIQKREYAHDTSITRTEDDYTVGIHGSLGDRAAAALGLPFEGDPGGYRLDSLTAHDKQLLRGILEGCGTVCFKSDSGTVGISFVGDERLLETVRDLFDSAAVEVAYGNLAETSSGGYYFSIDETVVPTVGSWLYDGSEESGLFAPSRRRKLRRSIEQAEAY